MIDAGGQVHGLCRLRARLEAERAWGLVLGLHLNMHVLFHTNLHVIEKIWQSVVRTNTKTKSIGVVRCYADVVTERTSLYPNKGLSKEGISEC